MDHELAKTLTTALVQFIDRERPEGTMCCSNTDCENIRAAFEEGEYDVVQEFLNTKLTRLTAFEKTLAEFVNDVLAKEPHNPSIWIIGSGWADRLLALAKKELLSCAGEEVHNAPSFIQYMPLYQKSRPFCYEPGGTCTNPHMDCINCPRKTTGGFNTSSGTSTAKAEE